MTNQPTEPSAELRAFASVMWQMFVALMNEGFEERQALRIIGQTIAAQLGGGTPNG